MENRIGSARMSPCLRIFIESLLEGVAPEILDEEQFVSNEGFAMDAALASRVFLESDKNYN